MNSVLLCEGSTIKYITRGWQLRIYDRVNGETIFDSDNTSLNKLSAEAYLALDEWAMEFKKLENIECNLENF